MHIVGKHIINIAMDRAQLVHLLNFLDAHVDNDGGDPTMRRLRTLVDRHLTGGAPMTREAADDQA